MSKKTNLKPDPVLKDFWRKNGLMRFPGRGILLSSMRTGQNLCLYDALRYTKQCKKLEQSHRKDGDLKEADEFLSGMAKTDKILHVINLVVYYEEKTWDGPRCLSDMMDVPPLFRPLFNDQKIQLLEVRNAGNLKFENSDNRDFFSMIEEFYTNNGHINLEDFKKKYPGKEIGKPLQR